MLPAVSGVATVLLVPGLVPSTAVHAQPFGALVLNATVPVDAVPPVPTFTWNAALLDPWGMVGLVPKPDPMVGAKTLDRKALSTFSHRDVPAFMQSTLNPIKTVLIPPAPHVVLPTDGPIRT